MQKSALKQNISLFIFLFINFLFALKYGKRVTDYAPIAAFALAGIQLLIWIKRDYLLKMANQLILVDIFILAAATCIFSYLFIKIPVPSLMVDRATVISSFWDNYFGNEYVYFAKSHRGNPPGPMPFYYIMALPFYLLGELGYFSLIGIVLFYLIIKNTTTPKNLKTVALLLIISSLFYMWEVISRSNILLNGCVVLISLLYFFSKRPHNSKFILITGVLCGLSISTRNVYVIPFIVAFIYALKDRKINIREFILIGCVSMLVFAATFIPFVTGYWNEFLSMNPFIIQSSYLMPFSYTLIFILLAFLTGFFAKSVMDVYFYSAVVLFLTIVGYYTHHIIEQGFENAFYESRADISYFILCVPFALYYLIKKHDTDELVTKPTQYYI